MSPERLIGLIALVVVVIALIWFLLEVTGHESGRG